MLPLSHYIRIDMQLALEAAIDQGNSSVLPGLSLDPAMPIATALGRRFPSIVRHVDCLQHFLIILTRITEVAA